MNLSQCQPHTAHEHGDGSTSGEPLPAEKTIGDKVTGGTVNGTGSFVMRAARVDKDYIHKHGQDMPEIRNWKWRLAKADRSSRGRSGASAPRNGS